ncbi:putative ketoacyl reductase [compost metagenome]
MVNNAVDNSKSSEAKLIKEKIAVVTGTSSGFGLLITLSLAQAGYRVIATMRDLSKQTKLLALTEEAGVSELIECMQLDVTKPSEIEQVTTTILHTWGHIDVLINNAGFAVGGYTEDVPMTEWYRQMDTNFFGVVAITKAILPTMRKQKAGMIINMSSVSGKIGFPGYAPYAASKFAVEGFSEALRLEMVPFGVKVVLVEPGSYKTDIWQKGFDQMCSPVDSPYRSNLETVLRYSRHSAHTAPDPQQVADIIVKIVQSKNPKLRYLVGKGSSALMLGKALLPWKSLERVLHRLLNKYRV